MHKFFKVLLVLSALFGIPVAIYLVGQATGFFGQAGGTPANLIIDAGSSIPDSHFVWKNLAQGGEEPGRMLASVVGKVAALHPNYIRIDNVFGNPNLDGTINDILATGAKPFISLSPLPDTPINWANWEVSVQNLIEHISGSLGISNVYYEVGNEPDLFGGWKTYGTKNYFDLYAHSVAAANRASNVLPFKIGGPATTQLYESWATDFAKFILANHLRLDFYSWHKYSMELSNFDNNAINASVWLTESGLPSNLELIISELGPDSNNNPVYDNGFSAIHTIATAATLEDSVSKIFNFEIKDGPGPTKLWGRWGILTNDKFGEPTEKPRYDAFLFLNNMVGNRVRVSGVGSWVKAFAKTDGKIIRTLVVNYDPNSTHTEAVPLNFINLPASPSGGPNENFEYKRIDWSGGVTKDIQIATTSANWSTLELMNPNTAAIMEIIFP